ncbi:MAG: ComF family protein [Gaiellaceae bacterium]
MLDLLLPQRCLGCSRPGSHLCERCRATLPRLRAPLCARCGAPTAWPVARCRECSGRRLAFASARAAVAYEGAARRLATSWKERGLRRLAVVAADLVAETVARPAASALVSVPPDGDRSRRRGHDPPAQLARELGERWELPVLAALVRARPLARQRGLGLAERRRNVAGAFAPHARVPAAVALVDEVYTRGSTAAAAASALRRAGARRVEVVTFARAIRYPQR